MATIDKNGDWHSELNGRYIKKDKADEEKAKSAKSYPDYRNALMVYGNEFSSLEEKERSTRIATVTKAEWKLFYNALSNLKRRSGNNYPDMSKGLFIKVDKKSLLQLVHLKSQKLSIFGRMTMKTNTKKLFDEYIKILEEKEWNDEWMLSLGKIAYRAKIPSCYFKSNFDALSRLIDIVKKSADKFVAYSEFTQIIVSQTST